MHLTCFSTASAAWPEVVALGAGLQCNASETAVVIHRKMAAWPREADVDTDVNVDVGSDGDGDDSHGEMFLSPELYWSIQSGANSRGGCSSFLLYAHPSC